MSKETLQKAKEIFDKDLERVVDKIKRRWRLWVLKEKSSKTVESEQDSEHSEE